MKDVAELLKLPPRILGALAVASGILLFSPDKIIEKLYMDSFRDRYGFTLGIVFVVSVSLLALIAFVMVAKNVKKKCKNKLLIKNQIAYLQRADSRKVELISYLMNETTHTALLPMHDGLVIELQNYCVISPAGSTHAVNMLNPQINYFLQPWVIERIENTPELRSKFGR